MATIFDTIVSELSRWGRHELPASPTPRLPEKPIDPLWDGTDFALLLGDIEHRCSSWSVDALLDAAESELEEGKAAHLRRAPVSSLRHLLTAMAYRHRAGAPESHELLGNIGWQLGENQRYAKAIEIGTYAYERRARSGAPPESLGLAAYKLAIYHFYVGDLVESRGWLNAVPAPAHNEEFRRFSARVELCEGAARELASITPSTTARNGRTRSLFQFRGARQPVTEVASLARRFIEASKDERLSEAYSFAEQLATLLFERYRYYSASADWFLRAGTIAQRLGDYHAAYHALLRSGNVRLETGASVVAAELLRNAYEQFGKQLEPQEQADLLSMLAVATGWANSAEARAVIQTAATLFHPDDLESVLAWAVKFGRRFATSEAYDIATYITDTAYRLVRRSSYYSPAVAQLFEAMAHVHYMQKHWVESITTLNVAHDVSFRHEDWDSACLALLRSSETYEAAKELALAKRCVQRASEFEGRIGETVSSHLLNRSGILFRQLSPSNDSGFSLLMPPLTEQLPGTVEFVSTLAAVEELTDAILTKLNTDSSLDWQSVGLSAGPILRMYGVALDRAGEQTKSAGMLWTAYRIQRLMRDYPEAAVTLHEYGVALSRANRLVAARRAYYVAMTLKRRHGSLNAQSADVSLKSFVKASVILGIGTNLAEHLKALREAMSRQTPAPSVLFDIHGSYDDLITIANGYILTGQAGIAGEVASEAAKQFDDSSDRGKHLGAVELGGLLIRVGRTDEALQYLRQAIAAFETDRQQISESHRTEWQRYVVPAVALFLDASYSHSQSLAGECLSKIELVKVRTLLERFGRIRVTPGAELSSEMAAQDEHNREATAKALAAHLVTKSSVIRGEFMEYQLRAQDEHVFLQSLESTAPEYVRLRRGLPFEPTDIVSERINDKSTRIFVLHQTPESIYVWHLDGHGQIATWRKIDVPAADLDRVAGAISDAASRHAWVGDALDWLSDLLFADVDVPAETDVCIVPSGRLIDLPFAAFRIRGQYLVEKWPLVILPSFSLAGFWSRSPTVDATKSLVLSDSLGDLTGAKEEAVAIANMMKSGLLVNKEMTRERILACLPDVDLLHVACHAIFDWRSPLDSGIPLADGRRFTCRDLMTLSTRGKVAFLSACESNKVATASGDELTGLFPSLLYSGFEAVVGSLWKVPDRETRKLALTFYRAVLDGRPLHCALRDAQLSLLYGTKNLSPYYWAAWQLVGNWQVRVSKEETLAQ